LEVALGGGRQKFLPASVSDPEYPKVKGERLDGRNLTEEWKTRLSDSNYVWNKKQFDEVDPRRTKHLLGLFEPSHMQYEHDRVNDGAYEPSLAEMTSKAIDILSQNKKGFFLMVEGGRIDHGHHAGNAFRALTDTIELSDAVRSAQKKVNLDDTLIIVTADHSHTLTMSGYPARGNDILGLVYEIDSNGNRSATPQLDALGLPYTTLGYSNGRGYTGENANSPEGAKKFPSAVKDQKGITKGRPDLSKVDTTGPNYLQEATIPLGDETHGGEDVAVFANGAGAYVVHGVMEQNWIFFVMKNALRMK
jgi:alkaline phosphatase